MSTTLERHVADHTKALTHATAAWVQLHAVTQEYQAAILRGDQRAAEELRQKAHDLLDANLDLNGQAAHSVKAILGS